MRENERPIDPYAEDDAATSSHKPTKNSLFTPFGVVVTLVAVLMIAVVAWGIYQNSLGQPQEGEAPQFALPLIGEEGEFSLAAHRGQVVVINFWGSWCGPCRDEAPMLQQIYEDYAGDDFVMVGIAVKDIESDSLAYIQEFGITYPNVMDLGGRMEDEYRTQGVPETFVIGKDGHITEFFFATPRESDLRAAIEEALEA